MSLLGMVEIPCLQGRRSFVMPAQAGIQDDGRWKNANLDSRFRGNDGREKVDFESTLTKSLGFEPWVV
jgi:hypothetical protein